MFEISQLPFLRIPAEQIDKWQPVTDPQVGDRVAIYSRGAWRLALVEKVGRTNVTCVYTTEGAITDAQKIAGFQSPERMRNSAAESERRAAEYEAQAEGVADDEKVQTGSYSYSTGAGLRASAVQSRDYAARERERADRLESLPVERKYEVFTNTTRKSVKISEAYKAV